MSENKFSFITDEEGHIDYKEYYHYSSDIICRLYNSNQSSLDVEEQKAVQEYFLTFKSYLNSLGEIYKLKTMMKGFRVGTEKYLSFMSSINLELAHQNNCIKKLAQLEMSPIIKRVLQRQDIPYKMEFINKKLNQIEDIAYTYSNNKNTGTIPRSVMSAAIKSAEEKTKKEKPINTKKQQVTTKRNTPNITKFFLLPIFIAIILLISTAELPYAFYTVMRIVVPLLSVIYLFFAFTFGDGFKLMHLPNIIAVVLWNPILPIYMDKETWVVIDIIVGLCEIAVSFYAYRLWKSAN